MPATNRLSTFALVALTAALVDCGPDAEPFARAVVIERLDEAIGGPKGVGQPGDFLLENDHFRAVILGGRHSMGPGLYGGSLVDADLQWGDPSTQGGNGRDQFNEMFPTVNMNIPASADPEDVTIASDGSDGGPAIIRVQSETAPFLTILGGLWGLVGAPDFCMSTDYVAEPGVPWLILRSTAIPNCSEIGDGIATSGDDVEYPEGDLELLDLAIETGLVIGDFFLSGGSLDVFAPGIGFDEDGAVFESSLRGENTFKNPFEFEFLVGVGDGISYGIAAKEGSLYVPLFTASQTATFSGFKDGVYEEGELIDGRFPADTAYTYERYFYVGHGDVGSVLDQIIDSRDVPHGSVSGVVVERGTGLPISDIDVFAFKVGDEFPYAQWRTDVHPNDDNGDGSFAGTLPVGEWELLVHDRGRPDPSRLSVTVTEGSETSVTLAAFQNGMFAFDVVDETGEMVPAKVTIFRTDGQPTRSPALGDGFIAGSPETLVFTTTGGGEVALADGRYYAVASRGLEYEIDVTDEFFVDADRGHYAEMIVERSIETVGWISADLHVHSLPSHDSGVDFELRVATMVAEGVEFFSATDHDVLSDFAPIIDDMGMGEWVQSAVGLETTTVEVGHFLGFPLQRDWLQDSGGAPDWTDMSPDEILAAIRKIGEDAGHKPMTFVAHPRDGILGYFDQYGFDPYRGEPGDPVLSQPLLNLFNELLVPAYLTWEFDGLELFTGKRQDLFRTPTQPEASGFAADDGTDVRDWMTRTMEEQVDLEEGTYTLSSVSEGTIDDWFSLLNLGYRFTALGNSDTHGTTSTEAGCPRNYVMSDVDEPMFIDDQAVADAVKEHRVVASYGPFVRMWIDGEPIGSDVVADGSIELAVEVQAPSWVDVDRVELYENGTLIRVFDVENGPSNQRFYNSVVLEPQVDSWYAVIVTGDEPLDPVFTPVEIPYVDLQIIVSEALGDVDAVSSLIGDSPALPRVYPVYPFALTNPIWVDVDGDGWVAPGLPDWLRTPAD